jgi:DNA polymerase (family 10)
MMTNEVIAETLEQLADLLEFQGANPFRLRAYRNGAKKIRELPESIADLVAEDADLTEYEGIGESVAEKCQELVATGKLHQLEEILTQIPRTVLDLLRVAKVGPKKAATLYNQLGVKDLDGLEAACKAGKVRELEGFGEKTETAILEGIPLAREANKRMLWIEADVLAQQLRAVLEPCKAIRRLEFGGSYRRGKETVGDIDILVTSTHPEQGMDALADWQEVNSIIGRGPTKMSVSLKNGVQVDLRVVPPKCFGAALQYFTGSKEHNVLLRGMAKDQGLKINEWGVFPADAEIDFHDPKDSLTGEDEADVYRVLGLKIMPPELREARHELEWAASGKIPHLIEESDIQGDLHMHTTATDGSASIEEMAEAARSRGLKYIAITDHSKRVSLARGLDAKRLRAQWKEIDRLNADREDDFLILKGIECDILENGEMDLPDTVLAEADWVIASLHYGQNQPRAQLTERILNAIRNPHVWMVAHPTGRLIHRRKPYDVDLEAVMQAAVEHKKFLELNASPERLDLNDSQLIAAKALGIKIVINTDAHSPGGLAMLRAGIVQARRGTLTKKDVANAHPWKKMCELAGR